MNNNRSNTTFRFPFDINTKVFIGLALLFYILSIRDVSNFFSKKDTLTSIAKKIEGEVAEKIIKFDKVLNALNDDLTDSTIDLNKYFSSSLNIQIYNNHKLINWNNNILGSYKDTFNYSNPFLYKAINGYYILYCQKVKSNNELTALLYIPIKLRKFYLGSWIEDDYATDAKSNIFHLSIKPSNNSYKITYNKQIICYINPIDNYDNILDEDSIPLLINALFFVFFGISIHTYFKVTVKKSKPIKVYLIMLAVTILVRLTTYLIGFPTDFSEYHIFSSSVVYVDFINKSLGDTFINVCLVFWLLLFYVVNVQGKVYQFQQKKWYMIFVALVFIIAIILQIYFVELIYNIVIDSTINFDTTLINQFNLLSFIGLIIFLVIFGILFLLCLILNIYLNEIFSNKLIKNILSFIIVSILVLIFSSEKAISYFIFPLWFISVMILFDYTAKKIKFDFNSFNLLIWIISVSLFGGLYIATQVIEKEKINRLTYAEKLTRDNEFNIKNKLLSFRKKILATPPHIIKFKDSTINLDELKCEVYKNYFNSYFFSFKYNLDIIEKVDSAEKVSLYNSLQNNEVVENWHITQDNDTLRIYTLWCPIINTKDTLAYVRIKLTDVDWFDNKYNTDLTLYAQFMNAYKEYNYSLALYNNKHLINRYGLYQFQQYLRDTSLKDTGYLYNNESNENLLYYFLHNNKTIVIARSSNIIYLSSTLFAYNFIIYFLTISLYILGNIIARSNLNKKRFINLLSLNLRLKIQMSILFVVLLALVSIVLVTSIYFENRIHIKSETTLSNQAGYISNELKNILFANKIEDIKSNKEQQIILTDLLKKLSDKYAIHITLYSPQNGEWLYSTQDQLYYTGILNPLISREVYHKLNNEKIAHTYTIDKVGVNQFISLYAGIIDQYNHVKYILHLPYLFSDTELTQEKNSIIVSTINISVFVFLISAIFSVLISNSVSGPFKQVVKQFTQINLSKTNEPLKWINNDEIGLLVKEYNRMLRKLENSTLQLAKSEREIAWREMAKQVAHEIKNPLTPMKISLQMLERAINQKSPKATEMTIRVTKTLIEQIDHLSLIATNFSMYAKLPDQRKEKIDLNEVLYSVTGMYTDDAYNEFLFIIPEYKFFVNADKNNLIRVFTNIIQNAIQAIPEGRKGNISLLVSKIKNNLVRVSISDNGSGINIDKYEKLFQPYFTTKSSGTGLGLAMCKDILEQFDGKLTFESVVDVGTTFHIDLPIYDHQEV